ncbi:MAG TPA: hypothetical protein DCX17_03765 [Firmicutes bacterium]|nr:hypothetical protein [Bacillota bacterium]
MITIAIIGLDPFIAERISHDIHARLAKIYATDDILVAASESYLFHDGVDQTDYHAFIQVFAPSKFRLSQDEVAKYLLTLIREHIIHGAIQFHYFEMEDRYATYDELYPRYVTSANAVKVQPIEASKVSDVFQGDIFAEENKKTAKSPKNKNK